MTLGDNHDEKHVTPKSRLHMKYKIFIFLIENWGEKNRENEWKQTLPHLSGNVDKFKVSKNC